MPDDSPVSLREIAERMDPDGSAERLYGNGPPFDPDRPQAYNVVSFTRVPVDEDPRSADAPESLVAEGSIDAGHLHDKVVYRGIPYLDTVYPSGSKPDELDGGEIYYVGSQASNRKEMYLNNLFFADYNAYDLGMVNRTSENESRPAGYTDKGIIESHRWVDPSDGGSRTEEWRSIRNVVDRHQEGVTHRVLWQNVALPSSRGVLGKRRNIAREFGERFGAAGFDIVGMCEIPNNNMLKRVRKKYAPNYADVDSRFAKKDLGVLVGVSRDGGTPERNITWKEDGQYSNAGPGGSGTSKEGWLRTVIEVPTLPDSPKFEVFVTHIQGALNVSPDRKQHAKLDQIDELVEEIAERNDEKSHQPKIVMGDFNVQSKGRGKGFGGGSDVRKGQYFGYFMKKMRSVGMQDVWLTYGGPGPNNKDCTHGNDGHTCDPFEPENGGYYRGNRLDYVFVEKPRPDHELHIDVSRAKNVSWPSSKHDWLSDHVGVTFDIITSPSS